MRSSLTQRDRYAKYYVLTKYAPTGHASPLKQLVLPGNNSDVTSASASGDFGLRISYRWFRLLPPPAIVLQCE
jgi:hypothetical protein